MFFSLAIKIILPGLTTSCNHMGVTLFKEAKVNLSLGAAAAHFMLLLLDVCSASSVPARNTNKFQTSKLCKNSYTPSDRTE